MTVTEVDLDKPTAIPADTPVATPPPVPDNMTVDQKSTGTTVDVNIDAPTPQQQAALTEIQKAFLEKVPDTYKEKEWVKNFAKTDNPTDELFKSYEHQLSQMGKKGEGLKVPGADATPEQKQEFRKAMGVPDKAEDYKYDPPKAPQGMEAYYQPDAGLIKTMQEAAFKGGMTPEAWQEQVNAYNSHFDSTVKDAVSQLDNQLKATQEAFAKRYGEKSPQVLANLDKAVAGAPDTDKAIFAALQPATKAAMASILQTFSEKYIAEDKLDFTPGMAQAAPMTEQEYGDKFAVAIAKVFQTQKQPHSAEHLTAKAELAKLRLQGEQVFKGK